MNHIWQGFNIYITYLTIFSITLSINCFPSTEVIAFKPMLIPNFAKFHTIPPPVSVRQCSLYLFILYSLSLRDDFATTMSVLFLLVCLFFGVTAHFFFTRIFPGNFFYLFFCTLLQKMYHWGDLHWVRQLINKELFFPSIVFFYHQKFFSIKALQSRLQMQQWQKLKVLLEISSPWKTPFFTDCFPLILTNHHLSDWLCMFYVSELKYKEIHLRSVPKFLTLIFSLLLLLKECGY